MLQSFENNNFAYLADNQDNSGFYNAENCIKSLNSIVSFNPYMHSAMETELHPFMQSCNKFVVYLSFNEAVQLSIFENWNVL